MNYNDYSFFILTVITALVTILLLLYYLILMAKCHYKYQGRYSYRGRYKWFAQGLTVLLQPVMETDLNLFGLQFGLRSKITHQPHWKNVKPTYFKNFNGLEIVGVEEKSRRDMDIFGWKVLPKTIFVEFTEQRRIILTPENPKIEWRLGFRVKKCNQIGLLWHKGPIQIMYDGGTVQLYGIDANGMEVKLKAEKKHYFQTKGLLYI